MDRKEEYKIEALIKECDSIGQGIRNLMLFTEKVIGLGLLVIGAGLTYGVKEKIDSILLILPIAVLGVMLYGVQLGTELSSMGGYKRYLEERINAKLGEQIFLWELFIAKERHRDFTHPFIGFVYFVVLVLTIYYSLSTASGYNSKIYYGIVIILLFLFIGLIISFINQRRAFDLIYRIAKESNAHEILIDQSSNIPQKD